MNKIRQTAPTLDKIRDDHVERYRFAANIAKKNGYTNALDVGCGVGYGSYLLATEAGMNVRGIDRDQGAIEYGREFYKHENVNLDVCGLEDFGATNAEIVTMFEIIEHTPLAIDFIAKLSAPLLVGSVPNEDFVPFIPGKVNAEHYRHFTPDQIKAALWGTGWRIIYMGYQPGKRGEAAKISKDAKPKRTIVFVAERE